MESLDGADVCWNLLDLWFPSNYCVFVIGITDNHQAPVSLLAWIMGCRMYEEGVVDWEKEDQIKETESGD